MKEEFDLSKELKDYFEIELLDSMAYVQGDITKKIKEFIKLLKDNTTFIMNNSDFKEDDLLCLIDKLAGKELSEVEG